MAVKITGLTPGSTPLSGTELLEVVQGANSRSISVSAIDHNTITGLQGGTTSQYYHLTASEEGFIFANSDVIDIGINTQTYIRVDNDDNDIEFDISNSEMFRINSSGVRIGGSAGNAPTVNEILESVNDTIDASATDIQLATAKLIFDTISLNTSTVTAQTTASNRDVILASAAPSGFAVFLQDTTSALITVKKIDASDNITVQGLSGNIDGAATKVLTVQYQSETFIWDGTNWFII